MTAVKERPTPADVDTETPQVMHGAHMECQRGAEFVTLQCGIAADWDERNETDDLPLCPLCWNAPTCRLCGAELREVRS